MTFLHYAAQRQGGSAQSAFLPAVIAHGNCVLLIQLPEGSARRRESLWEAIRANDSVQSTLDELTRDGLSSTPPFALVQWGEVSGVTSARAILRGDLILAISTKTDSVTLAGSGVATWREQQFEDVSSLEISVGQNSAGDGVSNPDDAEMLPLGSGVVVSSQVAIDFITAVVSSDPQRAPEVSLVTSNAPTPWSDPEATVSEVEKSSAGVAVDAVSLPDSVPTTVTGDAGEGSSYDYLFGDTMYRDVQDAAVRDEGEVPPQVALTSEDPTDAGDHDGHTVTSADLAKLRAGRKSRGQSPAVSVVSGPVLFIQQAGGAKELLARPIVVGRAPSVSKVSGVELPKLLTVAGPDQDISRNHAQFAVEGGTVVVTDLHSRNGTTIVLPGRPPQRLRQGEPTSVIVGTVVDLGSGVTFTVGEE